MSALSLPLQQSEISLGAFPAADVAAGARVVVFSCCDARLAETFASSSRRGSSSPGARVLVCADVCADVFEFVGPKASAAPTGVAVHPVGPAQASSSAAAKRAVVANIKLAEQLFPSLASLGVGGRRDRLASSCTSTTRNRFLVFIFFPACKLARGEPPYTRTASAWQAPEHTQQLHHSP